MHYYQVGKTELIEQFFRNEKISKCIRIIYNIFLSMIFIIIMSSMVICSEPIDDETEEFEDTVEFEKLISIIEKYSDLATKTRLNVDYVPGILTYVSPSSRLS